MFRIRTRASDGRSLNPGDILSIVLPTETFLNRQQKRNDDLSNYRRRCFSASNTSSENPKTRPQEHRECAQGRIWNWQAMAMETVSTNRSRSTIVHRFPALDFRTSLSVMPRFQSVSARSTVWGAARSSSDEQDTAKPSR